MRNIHILSALNVISLLFCSCSDYSKVTDPAKREDIASWYNQDVPETSSSLYSYSSSSEVISSSSVNIPASSAEEIPLSSSMKVLSSSSKPIPSSSSVKLSSSVLVITYSSSSVQSPSSSSGAEPSSSSVVPVSSSSASFDWASCEAVGKCGTFSDGRESPAKSYKWVFIGAQIWMAENLAYLPSVNAKDDHSLTVAKYYVYDHDNSDVESAKSSSNYAKYGVLYNWIAAMAGYAPSSVVQGVCPSGWHLPNSTEWGTLLTTVGGNIISGQKLKSKIGWFPSSGKINEDAYGFSALPGGLYQSQGFQSVGSVGFWWTATEGGDANSAHFLDFVYDFNGVTALSEQKDVGLSVRCVKSN